MKIKYVVKSDLCNWADFLLNKDDVVPVFLVSDFEKAKKRFLDLEKEVEWLIHRNENSEESWFVECFGVEK